MIVLMRVSYIVPYILLTSCRFLILYFTLYYIYDGLQGSFKVSSHPVWIIRLYNMYGCSHAAVQGYLTDVGAGDGARIGRQDQTSSIGKYRPYSRL